MILGLPCVGLKGGPACRRGKAFSIPVATADQAETDPYRDAIIKYGGKADACRGCKDRWGTFGQITPRVLTDGMADPDPAVRKRVFSAMMTMVKIDVAAMAAAIKG